MMILSTDMKHELMIDYINGERYLRPLSNEEIFHVINEKYSDDESEEKLNRLIEMGLCLDEIFDYAIKM